MGTFLSNIIWQICERMVNNNTHLLSRVLMWVFYPAFIINLIVRVYGGTTFIGLLVSSFLIALVCLPISMLVVVVISRLGDSFVDSLYGMSRKEDNSEVIRDSELYKLIPLKEGGEYEEMLHGLAKVEEEYGTSSRLVYERALCLVEMGNLKKARRCIKEFMTATEAKGGDDSYYNYCRQLLYTKNSPLSLDEIMKGSEGERPS